MIIKNLIIHHTGGTDANPMQDSSNFTVKQCDQLHKKFGMKSSLGWWVGYHYYIEKDGKVTQTRQDTEEAAHCVGWNNNLGNDPARASIGICMAGNFDATMPTDAQVISLKKLMKEKVAQYGIPLTKIVPHRAHAPKTCYGNKLSKDWASALLRSEENAQIHETKLGDSGLNVSKIQSILNKGGFAISNMNVGKYDEAMAQAVLYFQIIQNVQKLADVAFLRGEKIGPSTLKALINFK